MEIVWDELVDAFLNTNPDIIYFLDRGTGEVFSVPDDYDDEAFWQEIEANEEQFLQIPGFDYDLVLTEGPQHAQKLARQAAEEGRPLVVAAGGDGTVNEVINGLMLANLNGNVRPSLAVLPVGRGNDFAYGMGVRETLEENIALIARDSRKWMDIGKVSGGDYPNGRYFGNGIGVGFDTIDLKACGEAGIAACNVPDYGTTDVADSAIAMMLTLPLMSRTTQYRSKRRTFPARRFPFTRYTKTKIFSLRK